MRGKMRNQNIKRSQILHLKCAARARKIEAERLRLKPGVQSSPFDSIIEALLGGTQVKGAICFQRVCNEPVREHVRALPGLARCVIGHGDGDGHTADPFSDSSAAADPFSDSSAADTAYPFSDSSAAHTADPFSDSSAEPMETDPEPIDMENEPMDIDPEPVNMDRESIHIDSVRIDTESQSVVITIIVTCI